MRIADSLRDAAQMRQARAFDAFRSREEEENLLAWESVTAIANRLEHIARTELSADIPDAPADTVAASAGVAGTGVAGTNCANSEGNATAQEICTLADELRVLARSRLSFADELGFSEEKDFIEIPSGVITTPAESLTTPSINIAAAAPAKVATELHAVASETTACDGAAANSRVQSAKGSRFSANVECSDDADDFEVGDLEEVVLPVYLCGGDSAAVSVAVASACAVSSAANADASTCEKNDDAVNAPVSSKHVLPELIDVPLGASSAEVATFKHVCAGRDGKLCLFEDKDGHLLAVRSSRLA